MMSPDDEFILKVSKESPYREVTEEAIQYIKRKIGFSNEQILKVLTLKKK